MIPGEYFISSDPIIANIGKSSISLTVQNTGDRPIQVGSHTHFFEVNKALEFSRKQSYGFHLNIPAGTSIRFEPGDGRTVELTEFSGKRIVYGFSGLVNGSLDEKKDDAFSKAKEQGFRGMEL
ncbi:MAG: urease subunit beta [Nitrosopumilus sp.]|jgi:urease subunit beta|nr:urease subunit beta [Nitrosopumilus sp.]MBT3574030.1 urease subunit beta [Nitrosopumilus sp.]MBT3861578.1 urease subunit beta [Nitrosopumilus sp.]MBT3955912.1 urease subunit beta [Nitrosopumilus sp.]MBT4298478.1 urease subunit beta [Nitrosopumilus sp.]